MSKHILAITGNIGGGKSAIAKLLRLLGYTVLDADKIAKELLYGKYLARVQVILGDDIISDTGEINKELIRSRLLGDKKLLKSLNFFTRTVVIPEIIQLAKASTNEPCFVEIPLLFEFYGRKLWRKYFDGAIAVCCEESVAFLRIKIRNQEISETDIKALQNAHLPYKQKFEWADVMLDTTDMHIDEYEPWVMQNWPKIETSPRAQ